MNPDVLASLRADESVQAAYHVLDTVQRYRPAEVQVAAVLLTALTLADELGTRLPDLLTTLDNLRRDSTRQLLPNMVAMGRYWREEVL